MSTSEVSGFLGNIQVYTTQGRGQTPEELAEQALDRIISVGNESHPLITEQAQAFKREIKRVLIHYMHAAIRGEKVTLVNKFTKAGFPELVKILED